MAAWHRRRLALSLKISAKRLAYQAASKKTASGKETKWLSAAAASGGRRGGRIGIAGENQHQKSAWRHRVRSVAPRAAKWHVAK